MPKVAYVGTFDPVHNGHVDIATRAAAAFDEVIIGVYKSPPTKTLMFGTDERVELFAESVRDAGFRPRARRQIHSQRASGGLRLRVGV